MLKKYAKGKAAYNEVIEARKIAHKVYLQTEETYDTTASKESIVYKAAYEGAIYTAILYEGLLLVGLMLVLDVQLVHAESIVKVCV